MPVQLIAILASLILAGVVVLHIALVSGAPLGQFAWGGQEQVLPLRRRLGSAVSALVLAAFAWVILIHGTVLETLAPREWTQVAMYVFAAQFALNSLANLMSKSRAEKLAMTPLTIILTICCLVLAIDI